MEQGDLQGCTHSTAKHGGWGAQLNKVILILSC